MATSIQVTLDCADPDRVAAFWAEALHYTMAPPPAGHETWPAFLVAAGVPEEDWNSASSIVDPDGIGPRWYFQRVPELRAGKNRMHVDLNIGGGAKTEADVRVARVDAEVARLIGLGATDPEEVTTPGERWVVMHDPEGNEFCVQ
jgi:glyoxalase superfamily protein